MEPVPPVAESSVLTPETEDSSSQRVGALRMRYRQPAVPLPYRNSATGQVGPGHHRVQVHKDGATMRRDKDAHMTTTMDLDTERFPLGEVLDTGAEPSVRPFGLSVARWDANVKFERELIHLDPDTQIGMFGDRPLHTITSGGTTCQIESDGRDAIALDYPVDDK